MNELREAAVEVLVGGYVVLILALTFISVTWRSRRESYKQGYEHGFERGDRLGYERYGEEVRSAWADGRRAATHAARTRAALTPRADWGETQRVSPE